MRLHVTLPELEKGSVRVTGNKSRRLECEQLATAKEPVAITPVRTHDGKTVCAVLATGMEVYDLKFRPVWCRLYTACSISQNKITRFFAEFEHGKYMIDIEGAHKAEVTTSGNGADPRKVAEAETLLGDLLSAPERSHLLAVLIQHIQRSF